MFCTPHILAINSHTQTQHILQQLYHLSFSFFLFFNLFKLLYPALLSILFQQPSSTVMDQNLFLSIPLKKADKIKWTPVLLAYIIMSYSEEGKKYEADCELLDSLRNHALNQTTNDFLGLEDLTM